ncbi:MAG TPA: FkbM family methyltransferase [Candidatus Binataceae bacterium]|nr:FkbM family methyltransferase [Candidatus Binataceae bacterium]
MPNLLSGWFYFRALRNWPEIARVRLARRGGPLTLRMRDGVTLALSDGDNEIWAFQSVYRRRCYDRDFSGLPADGLVVDLGANVGIFALYAASRLVPHGRVVAVEPNPRMVEVLKANALARSNVMVVPFAIDVSAGTRTLYVTESSLGCSFYQDRRETSVAIEVGCIACADFLSAVCGREGRVSLLKCNAEGIEYPLLLETEPDVWARVDRLAIKYHEGDLVGMRDSRLLADAVRRLGYRVLRHESIWRTAGLTTGIITAARPL